MACVGKVLNGAVILPPGLSLPDGMELEVRLPDTTKQPSWHEALAAFAGMADDLPADLARNHDHYLHGHPKK
jgi:hypothetical protein